MNITFRTASSSSSISRMWIGLVLLIGIAVAALSWWQFRPKTSITADPALQSAMASADIRPLHFGEEQDPNLVALGEALFFDKVLSGNQDISCATCHHPEKASADNRDLPIGVGGIGLGAERVMGSAEVLVPRNAPEIFNRGSDEWSTMFWDGRIAFHEVYDLDTPADEFLPEGLNGVLAAQALFPPTSRHEMRGEEGDNDLADIADGDVVLIWEGIMERLMAIPGYHTLFAAAYPDMAPDEWTIAQVGNAIAAYEIEVFTFEDAPWDLFVGGDADALSAEQLRGAQLFFGDAGCAQCHNGPLLTDQQYHNIGVPHNGPGKTPMGTDTGRAIVTGNFEDSFAFRTPPLRNVALTGPYMHNGYYATLEEAIAHHFNAETVLETYPDDVPDARVSDLSSETLVLRDMIGQTLAPQLDGMSPLSNSEMSDLIAFLESFTSPSATDLAHLTPDSVPSGLPVTD